MCSIIDPDYCLGLFDWMYLDSSDYPRTLNLDT